MIHNYPYDESSAVDSTATAEQDRDRIDTAAKKLTASQPQRYAEFGGQAGPEPTRFGDWEKNGRCTDF